MISQSKVFYNQNYKKRLEEKKMILDLTNVPFYKTKFLHGDFLHHRPIQTFWKKDRRG